MEEIKLVNQLKKQRESYLGLDCESEYHNALIQERIAVLDEVIQKLENLWQPIETAPRDLTDAILANKYGSVRTCYLYNGMWFDHGNSRFIPTHWQPLPQPPKDK